MVAVLQCWSRQPRDADDTRRQIVDAISMKPASVLDALSLECDGIECIILQSASQLGVPRLDEAA